MFQGLVLTTTVLHCKQNCLCHEAARLNSPMFTKCLKTTEQKSMGFKQEKSWTSSLKNKSPAHTVTTRILWCHKHTFIKQKSAINIHLFSNKISPLFHRES